jgi:2-polyprenyl-3-methyl-5-hydroxy-6-metoxy-1,4-benzoquinol methylase
MSQEKIHALDAQTLQLFAEKGRQGGANVPQVGNANAVKVRRVMQIVSDLAKTPFAQLRILDLGCGEGVYAIEAALRGATVVAVDGRCQRMDEGAKAAQRLGLDNLHFEQADIRLVTTPSHGQFDVIFCLGILYHFDKQAVLSVLENVYAMTKQLVVIDSFIALEPTESISYNEQWYAGTTVREHGDDDAPAQRKQKLLASLDNTWSFWLSKDALFRLLQAVGFTSVFECHAPLEPGKPAHRVTVVAVKANPVQISAYPWLNGKTEAEIEDFLATQA